MLILEEYGQVNPLMEEIFNSIEMETFTKIKLTQKITGVEKPSSLIQEENLIGMLKVP